MSKCKRRNIYYYTFKILNIIDNALIGKQSYVISYVNNIAIDEFVLN